MKPFKVPSYTVIFAISVAILLWIFRADIASGQQLRAVYLLLLLVLVGGRSRLFRNRNPYYIARDTFIWLGIILLLMLAYAYAR